MNNPARVLFLASRIVGAPDRRIAAQFFAVLCAEDLNAAAYLAEFLVQVVPDTVEM